MALETNLSSGTTTHTPAAEEAESDLLKRARKAETARTNGARSKGPITAEGKDKSSRNAIRHGLTANKHTLLTTEFADEYDEVHQAFIADLRPATKAELRLVQKIANLDWRLERLVMMETCIFSLETGVNAEKIADKFESIDGIGFIVEAWKESSNNSQCLDLLRRYMGTLQHQFNTTLNNFYKLEKHRLARTHGGRNLDEELGCPYQVPGLETTAEPNEPTPEIAYAPKKPNEPMPASSNNATAKDAVLRFIDFFYDFVRDDNPEIIPVLDRALKQRYGS